MKHYGHMCLKRTLVWSTSKAVSLLGLGPVVKGVHRSLVKTAVKYQDRDGNTRYKGNGKTLKGTEPFSYKSLGWDMLGGTLIGPMASNRIQWYP